MKIEERIVSIAQEFKGLVEVKSNAKWDDKKTPGPDAHAVKLEALLKRAGHQDGWAYCMSFCEGVWVTAYEDAKAEAATIKRIQSILGPGVMASYETAKKADLISLTPKVGAIMFMQSGGSWKGHAGIVTAVHSASIETIEANTSPGDPNERDGGIGTGGIWDKKRSLISVNVPRKSGLWIRGFLNPLAVASHI